MKMIGGIVIGTAVVTGVYVAVNWAPERSVKDLRARWGRAPSSFLKAAGMTVHLRDEGPRDDPSPIVLLHGTLSSLHTWNGWAEALTSNRRVIRLDLPGFGLTGPSPDRAYSVKRDMRLVLAVLDALGVERCVMGGNSHGGGVALRIALEHPSRVDKLILVDSDGYRTKPISMPIAFYFAGMPMNGWMLRNTFPRGLMEQGLRNVYGDPKRLLPEVAVRYRELTECKGNRHALLERGRQWGHTATHADRIAELKLPTLIMWGGRDRLIPPDTAERFHRDIAGSTLVTFADLGHLPQEEDPFRTVEPVKRFLGFPSSQQIAMAGTPPLGLSS
jgi:pimeloyl-ACP methyl ester carboxylesterase